MCEQLHTAASFDSAYASALLRPGPTVLEVITDKEDNFACHKKLGALAAEHVQGLTAALSNAPLSPSGGDAVPNRVPLTRDALRE